MAETESDIKYRYGKLFRMSNLKQIREARGLNQDAVAEAINVTVATVSRYEKEDQRLDLTLLRKLAAVLKCRISDIAGETTLDDSEKKPASLQPAIEDDVLRRAIESAAIAIIDSNQPLTIGALAILVPRHYRIAASQVSDATVIGLKI